MMGFPHMSREPPLSSLLYSSTILLGLLAGVGCQLQTPVASSQNATDQPHLSPLQKCDYVAGGFLMGHSTDLQLNMSDSVDRNLSRILDRNGPDMRPSRDFKDFEDITVEVAKRAWRLLHEHTRQAVNDRAEFAQPALYQHLNESRVSTECLNSVRTLFERAKQLDSWAIRLMNSWGTFPMSGIYEGTYGSVGSFHTCLDIEANNFIGHAHYCSVTFRPLMPARKDYELILRKEPAELRQMFEKSRYDHESGQSLARGHSGNGSTSNINPQAKTTTPGPRLDYRTSSTDAFTDILEHAQYHHVLYYKIGTCWPIACSPFDVRRATKLFARKSVLLNGPVKCYSKFADDYEQPDTDAADTEVVREPSSPGAGASAPTQSAPAPVNASVHGTNQTVDGHNATTADANKKQKPTLVISVWDVNNGIFIWKPHFNRAHKIALAIILAVTSFIGLMTLIDICLVRLPPLYEKFVLCLRGMPLNFYDDPARVGSGQSFALCTKAGGGRRQKRVAFSRVPSDNQVPPDAFHPATLVDGGRVAADGGDDDDGLALGVPPEHQVKPRSFFWGLVDDCSAVTNLSSYFHVSEGQMRNDILCMNGIRCITMVWIILTHTMAYNDWSAFGRTREIELALQSMLTQPLFNGSYLVDTFFLMSGLLSAYTAFKHCQGKAHKFNSIAFILGRWLRLTPQIFLISMVFILFPTLSYGPHWYPIVGEFSENCVKNWWINVLHLQAFYKPEEMCNFVTWWISIDFFYHFLAVAIIWAILAGGHKWGSTSLATVVGGAVVWQSYRHYTQGLPPNILSTIPQTGAMWTKMTLGFFWQPYTHSVPFFFGFYIGYLMALKRKLITRWFNTRRALIGWIATVSLLLAQSYSTYWWVTGQANWSRAASTLFCGVASLVWASSLCWIILACQHGYGGFINTVLSWKVFVVLGKSSYLIYLSHFMVLFMYFGNQSLFLEPSPMNMLYIIVGNIVVSTLTGIFMCSVYEIPWLKMHRRLMKYV